MKKIFELEKILLDEQVEQQGIDPNEANLSLLLIKSFFRYN
jgi:hypothetical protein